MDELLKSGYKWKAGGRVRVREKNVEWGAACVPSGKERYSLSR